MKQFQATSLFIADEMSKQDYLRLFGQSMPDGPVEPGLRVELFGGFAVWVPKWVFELNFSEVQPEVIVYDEGMGLPSEISGITEEVKELDGEVITEELPAVDPIKIIVKGGRKRKN